MNLFHCVPGLAHQLVVQSGAILVLYLWIAFGRWLPAARAAESGQAKAVWYSIFTVFIVCGVCGYGTTVLAGWYPGVAYSLKNGIMSIGIVACLIFIHCTKAREFITKGESEKMERLKDIAHDRQLTTAEALRLLRETIDND